jgi:death on curing protein
VFRIFPTVAEAIEVHRLVIQEYGGHDGIRDKGLLESAVFRPQVGYYQNIFEEAAALMDSLANNQAFVDGNKRVAFLLTDSMLRANGFFLDVEPRNAHAFLNDSASKKEGRFSLIVEWIKSFVKPMEQIVR